MLLQEKFLPFVDFSLNGGHAHLGILEKQTLQAPSANAMKFCIQFSSIVLIFENDTIICHSLPIDELGN